MRVGGGNNHRYNLSDGVLLKDNHIGAAGGVKEAVKMAKAYAPFVRKIEVEVETFEMVQDAVESGADIIMLDNMDNDLLKQSIDYIAGRAEIEISGNVTKENIERIKNFGVNYVSSGALTHSAPILDISLKNFTCSLERTLTDERRDQESKNRKSILKSSAVPVPGVTLAKDLDVSRQIIVSDIALLRANGPDDPFHKQRLYDSKTIRLPAGI